MKPGHGAKGRQRWLHDDGDLNDLYQLHKGKKEIMFWCYSVAQSERSRSRSPLSCVSKSSTSKVAQSLMEKREIVEEIVKKLKEKHQDKFSPPQINTWAHCIHMKTHLSYDDPPDNSFFRGHSKNLTRRDIPSTSGVAISPSKRISLCSECIDQMQKWHQLFEKGIISKEQYKELVDKMWVDIKRF